MNMERSTRVRLARPVRAGRDGSDNSTGVRRNVRGAGRPMPKRMVSNPKRRITPRQEVDTEVLARLEGEARYIGSAHHKRYGADYGFSPPANPRPNKSLCDGGRSVGRDEAEALFREGMQRGMISTYRQDGLPKYVWAVASDGRAFEAKVERGSRHYHGYELGDDDGIMQRLVLKEWRARCRAK